MGSYPMKRFNRINPDRSIPTQHLWEFPWRVCRVSIVSIQTDQSRLWYALCVPVPCYSCFNRINPDRSIPTTRLRDRGSPAGLVSIVSIQTDQSWHRLQNAIEDPRIEFQSYQSRRINPDKAWPCSTFWSGACFNRINPNRSIPTGVSLQRKWSSLRRFNRINWDRSIPTPMPLSVNDYYEPRFQSYQSRQINPDIAKIGHRNYAVVVSIVSIKTDQSRLQMCRTLNEGVGEVSIVSIQTDQSRPGKTSLIKEFCARFQSYQSKQINPDQSVEDKSKILSKPFQSYQFRQINPDCYLCGARRGAALWGRMAKPIFWRTKWLKNIQQILYNPG